MTDVMQGKIIRSRSSGDERKDELVMSLVLMTMRRKECSISDDDN
jgi:uncharacterized protein YrrD